MYLSISPTMRMQAVYCVLAALMMQIVDDVVEECAAQRAWYSWTYISLVSGALLCCSRRMHGRLPRRTPSPPPRRLRCVTIDSCEIPPGHEKGHRDSVAQFAAVSLQEGHCTSRKLSVYLMKREMETKVSVALT